jgi:hypothetical protein
MIMHFGKIWQRSADAMSASGRAAAAGLPVLGPRPLKIEREQAGEGVLGRNVLGPAVSRGAGAVERVMGVGEPARALVVEVGERPLLGLDRRLGCPWPAIFVR